MPIKFHEGSKTFHIYNKHLSYITCIMENGQMENLYYGKAMVNSLEDRNDVQYDQSDCCWENKQPAPEELTALSLCPCL